MIGRTLGATSLILLKDSQAFADWTSRRSDLCESEQRIMLRPTRLLAFGGLVLVALLYWQPIHTYLHTERLLRGTEADVSRLQTQKQQLELRIATVGTGQELVREARQLGFVKPGERLFIVKGIAAWRRHQHS